MSLAFNLAVFGFFFLSLTEKLSKKYLIPFLDNAGHEKKSRLKIGLAWNLYRVNGFLSYSWSVIFTWLVWLDAFGENTSWSDSLGIRSFFIIYLVYKVLSLVFDADNYEKMRDKRKAAIKNTFDVAKVCNMCSHGQESEFLEWSQNKSQKETDQVKAFLKNEPYVLEWIENLEKKRSFSETLANDLPVKESRKEAHRGKI